MSEFRDCAMALDFHDGAREGWVSVSDRLPGAHQRVLASVTYGNGRVEVGSACWMPPCPAFPKGQWWAVSAWGFQQTETVPIDATQWRPWPRA